MNPSNTQVTPEIKKVIDSNGDGHTVIPTPHTHAQSEVSGLTTALAAKADTSAVNAALNGKASVAQVNAKASKVSGAVSGHFAGLDSNGDLTDSGVSAASFSNRVAAGTNGSIIVADASGKIGRSPKTIADLMPATAIDSTPTANSTNLVTSGGVKAALNGKMDNKTIDASPTSNADHLVSSKGVKNALEKKISFDGTYNLFCQDSKLYFDTFPFTFQAAAELDDWIHVKGFPNIVKLDIIVEEHDNYHFLTTASLFIAAETAQPNARFRVNLLIGNTVYVATGTATNYQMDDYTWDNNYFTKFGTLDNL